LALVLLSAAPRGFAAKNSVCLSFDAHVRLGLEHAFNDRLGLKYDLGASPLGTVVADVLAVVYLLAPEKRWQFALCPGIPYAGAPMTFDEGMVSLGVTALTRYRFSDRVSLDLRTGVAFPFYLARGKPVIRTYFWPDLSLGVTFTPRRSAGRAGSSQPE
jgi:hypothetical protein